MYLPKAVVSAGPSQAESDRQFEAELLAAIPHVRAFCAHLCGRNLGEDMAQEVLTKAWKARSLYRSRNQMKAWLFAIVRNEYKSHQRRAWRQVTWDQNAAERIAAPPLQQQWASELADVRRALSSLPENQREALLLIGAADLSYEDAANVSAAAVGTMKSRVARARARLLKILDESGTGPGKLPLPESRPPVATRDSRISRSGVKCAVLWLNKNAFKNKSQKNQ